MKYFLGSTAGVIPLREIEESHSLSQKAQKELRRCLDVTWVGGDLVQLAGETELVEIRQIDPYAGTIVIPGGEVDYTEVVLPGM